MSDLGDFKNIADSIMEGIKVDGRLKQKTMAKIQSRETVSPKAYLIPVISTCILVLVISFFIYRGYFGKHINNQVATAKIEEEITLSDNQEMGAISVSPWEPGGTMEEAEQYMDGSLLLPPYIPEGFKLTDIYLPANQDYADYGVMLQYRSDYNQFFLHQSKLIQPYAGLDNFKEIDINGVKALMAYFPPEPSTEPTQDAPPCTGYVELTWTVNGIQYIINGGITEEEALNIARSMLEHN